jgi:hypothetical protein
MKNILLVFLLLFISCEKDEIFEIVEEPTQIMVFEEEITSVKDGDDLFFDVLVVEDLWLVISNKDGSVITKEVFIPTLGVQSKKIFTKTLPKGELSLELRNGTSLIKGTLIQIN